MIILDPAPKGYIGRSNWLSFKKETKFSSDEGCKYYLEHPPTPNHVKLLIFLFSTTEFVLIISVIIHLKFSILFLDYLLF